MFTNQGIKLLKKIIKKYGADHQIDRVIEECSELVKALLKFRRNKSGSPKAILLRRDVVEEIADVIITVEHLKIIFDCETEVSAVINQKLARQLERMEKEGKE